LSDPAGVFTVGEVQENAGSLCTSPLGLSAAQVGLQPLALL
jgi:hypothetical protein